MAHRLKISLILTRKNEMPLTWDYAAVRQARFFASLAESRGYHVRWIESYE
jgi:hypothetical protein